MHSNYTLRFPRSGREAFGHDVSFDGAHPDPDRLVGYAFLVLAIFLAGVFVGAA